jgi:hypothetical protein
MLPIDGVGVWADSVHASRRCEAVAVRTGLVEVGGPFLHRAPTPSANANAVPVDCGEMRDGYLLTRSATPTVRRRSDWRQWLPTRRGTAACRLAPWRCDWRSRCSRSAPAKALTSVKPNRSSVLTVTHWMRHRRASPHGRDRTSHSWQCTALL